MSDVTQVIHEIIPKLRHIAPQTYWFSVGFGFFNTVVGYALFNTTILVKLQVVGVVPLKVWAIVFLIHGLVMLWSLLVNSWRTTRTLHIVGVIIKTAWLFELISQAVVNHTFFLLYIWSLLVFLQIIVCIHFTPRMRRDQ